MALGVTYFIHYQASCVANQELFMGIYVFFICLKFVLEKIPRKHSTACLVLYFHIAVHILSPEVCASSLLFEINTEVFNLFQSVNYLSNSLESSFYKTRSNSSDIC